MLKSLKIVIPTAGFARRMRPQTWSKPKPLVSVAGKTALDHLLEGFRTLPAGIKSIEYIIIVGAGLGQEQIPAYMKEHYPQLKVHYVLQPQMLGQSDAFSRAGRYLHGPVITIFADTLIETDFSFLADETLDGVAWVKQVEDARRFGVAEVGPEGIIHKLKEKPPDNDNTLAVVGCYYFKDGQALFSALKEQFRQKRLYNGEYYLADAINIMIERGAKMRVQVVNSWLDTGTIEATLLTNQYLLEHGCENSLNNEGTGVTIIRPVYIHPQAHVSASTIGPHVSVGAKCTIDNSKIENTILEEGASVSRVFLKGSFIGRQANVEGRSGEDPPVSLNIGDDSSVIIK